MAIGARFFRLALVVAVPLVVSGFASPVLAHGLGILGSGSLEQIGAELAAVFGPDASFSARGVMTEKDADREPRISEIGYFVSEGRLRLEKDLSTLKVAGVAPSYVAELVRKKTAVTVVIVDTRRSAMFIVYPQLKAYVEVSQPPQSSRAAKYEIEQREAGTEVVEGRTCKRREITAKEGREGPVTVWEDEGPKGVPVQVRSVHNNFATTVVFRHVNRSKPDASLFALPEGYARHASLEELIGAQK
jgi:hypothetical protein